MCANESRISTFPSRSRGTSARATDSARKRAFGNRAAAWPKLAPGRYFGHVGRFLVRIFIFAWGPRGLPGPGFRLPWPAGGQVGWPSQWGHFSGPVIPELLLVYQAREGRRSERRLVVSSFRILKDTELRSSGNPIKGPRAYALSQGGILLDQGPGL